jgi:hypothetical protein
VTARDLVQELTSPNRKNDLEARRRKLGLSRVALGRILEVDPATVFRHERGPLAALWDYALRGIEAEAADKSGKQVLRDFKSSLSNQTFIPDQFAARGVGYIAEKMHEARRQHAQGSSEKARVKRIADRAEARAKVKP